MKRDMICIMCPLGCQLHIEGEGENIKVSGNSCIRGERFAKEEIVCPKRIVTTSVKTDKGPKSCKTTNPVPKDKIFDVMREVEKLRLKKVKFGQVIIKNVLGLDSDIIITAND